MQKLSTIIFLFCFSLCCIGQQTSDFENFGLLQNEFLNGKNTNGGFQAEYIFLPNTYDNEFDFWEGWAISSMTDTTTAGFTNQYSAYAGQGVSNSTTYAICYAFDEQKLIFSNTSRPQKVEGMYITNSTYAALTMKNGDQVAKRFGGIDGNDPDYFLLTISGYKNGVKVPESVEFYLADYRFEDNSRDYIIKDWTYVDLTDLGEVDSIGFALSSSDVGQFGMNTPAYFCMDDFIIKETVNTSFRNNITLELFPNPFQEYVIIKNDGKDGIATIYNQMGQIVENFKIKSTNGRIQTTNWRSGIYFLYLNGMVHRLKKL